MNNQLTLFEISDVISEPIEQTAKSSIKRWSYSRRSQLEQCPRRYYYEYYGSNSRTAKTEPYKDELRIFKALDSRHLIAGKILHQVICRYLKRAQQGENWSNEQVLQHAKQRFRQQSQYLYVHKSFSTAPERKNSNKLEFYYNFDNAVALYESTEKKLLLALENFLTHPEFTFLRISGSEPTTLLEEYLSYHYESFKIGGRIDLLYFDSDRIAIVDWKLGDSREGEDNLQLFAYALGAIHRFDYSPNKIDLYEAHLASGTVSMFAMCNRTIRRTKSRIIQDLKRMQAVDIYGHSADADAFDPCAQPRICQLCSFQQICPKE